MTRDNYSGNKIEILQIIVFILKQSLTLCDPNHYKLVASGLPRFPFNAYVSTLFDTRPLSLRADNTYFFDLWSLNAELSSILMILCENYSNKSIDGAG